MRTSLITALAVLGGLLLLGTARVAKASIVEQPDYEVTADYETFEVRQYGPVIEARAPIGAYRELNQGFRMVGGYIFGDNANESGESEKIAMTAPVGFTEDADQPTISFIMPAEYQLSDLPTPTDGRVELVEVPGRTMAAMRFNGTAKVAEVKRRTAELEAALEARGLQTTGSPIVAQYNPPWIPGFLRRNEILIPVVMP